MRADVMAFISLMFGAIVVGLLVKNYKGTAASINAVGSASSNIIKAYGV
jgi:hypothetical protein